MGYRGKVGEQEKARELRASGMTLAEIAAELGVAKSSVSLWVRDVPFTPSKRRYGARVRPNALMRRRQAEIDWGLAAGRERIAALSERDLLVAGAALYAGEGAKRDRQVVFANSDPRMVKLFMRWLRTFFSIDESRLRIRLYLHEDQDLDVASAAWVESTGIPLTQHRAPYRAEANPSIRTTKHPLGCVSVIYADAKVHREVMGLVHALLNC